MNDGETLRATLERLGYADAIRARLAYYPEHADAFEATLAWTPASVAGAHMRRVIDAYDAFARLVRETTRDPVPVDDLLETLMVIALG